MPSERQPFAITDLSAGQMSDFLGMVQLPGHDLLYNLWIDSGVISSRPFLKEVFNANSPTISFGRTHDNKLAYTDSSFLYIDFSLVDALSGSTPLRTDISQQRTLFANGSKIIYWDGSTHSTIAGPTNVYALATIHGFTKERVVYVSSTDKRTIKYSSYILTEFEDQIIDSDNINDAWTDGGSIYNFPYEIIDLVEFKNVIFVFTTNAIFTLTPDLGLLDETDIFFFSIEKFQDVQLHDTPVVKATNTVYFVTKQGVGVIGLTEFNNFSNINVIPMTGMRDTILTAIDPATVRLSVDIKRNLIYLKASDTKTYINILNADNVWFEWDLPINSTAIAETVYFASNETYLALNNDNKIYRFIDDPDPVDNGIEIKWHTGLLDMDDPISKKHLRTIALDLKTNADKIDYAIDADNRPINDKLLTKQEKDMVDEYRIVKRSGQRGNKIKFIVELIVYGKTIIHGINAEYLTKPARRNLNHS